MHLTRTALIALCLASALPSESHAETGIKALIERLRGDTMPAGIVKTNGRIEATQIDVASKYAGRLKEVAVNEGDEVTAGQVVARIDSPEYEAQSRAAEANVLKARQALAEAEALIAQRKSDQLLAHTDVERGKDLLAKGYLTKQVFDQRTAKSDVTDAALKAAEAQRDQAQFAIKSAEAEAEQVKAILVDLTLRAPERPRAISGRPHRRSRRGGPAHPDDPRSLGCLYDGLSAGERRGQTRARR